MKKLVLATANEGKIRELRERLVALVDCSVISLIDLGQTVTVVEDASTFAGNAEKKALATLAVTGLPSLADDSGLVVDALGGRPGVHSARYGGPKFNDAQRCLRLLEELHALGDVPRTARFEAVLAYARAGEKTTFFHGTVEGTISFECLGTNGFGYDPIFVPQGYDCTMAQLDAAIKAQTSHRARALDAFVAWIGNTRLSG